MFSEENTTWLEDFSIASVGRLQMEEYSVLQSPLDEVRGRYWVAAMGRSVIGGCIVVLVMMVPGMVGGCGGGGGGGGGGNGGGAPQVGGDRDRRLGP